MIQIIKNLFKKQPEDLEEVLWTSEIVFPTYRAAMAWQDACELFPAQKEGGTVTYRLVDVYYEGDGCSITVIVQKVLTKEDK